jgi:succinylglutamate desuccinylase
VALLVVAVVATVIGFALARRRDQLAKSSRMELENANRELRRELSLARLRKADDGAESVRTVIDLRKATRGDVDDAIIDLADGRRTYEPAEVARLEALLMREIDLILDEAARASD